MRPTRTRQLAAWAVHVYTASGAVWAFLGLMAAVGGQVRAAFGWLAVQVVIDSTDGVLARLVRVREALPHLDGSRLDDIVDYLAYVLVPAVLVVTAGVASGMAAWLAAAAMLVSSALGFSSTAAKTPDHYFTGFPSYWNVVVFYLVAFRSPPALNTAVLLALSALVFVPIRYVYPSRTPELRPVTIGLGLLWGASMIVALVTFPRIPASVLALSLPFPLYYIGLSLALEWRRRPGARRAGP